MFFLLRSAVCIGLVVAALPDHPGQPVAPLTAVADGTEVLCRAEPARCLALLRESLRSGAAEAAVPLLQQARLMPSRDSLVPADRRPAWAGRARRPGAGSEAIPTGSILH